MFWTPRPFSSLIYFLNAQCGKAIQQTAQLYVGLCIVSLFLSMSNSVALIAGRVSGNNQWIQSQNKSANVVPSSWVNKQFPNKILSTALHVCVNTVLPLWWSGQRHSSYTEEVIRFLQLYAEDVSFFTEYTTQGFLWVTGAAFCGMIRHKKSEGKKILVGIFERE